MSSNSALPFAIQTNPRLQDWFSFARGPGLLTLKSGKVEIGQGIHLALRQIAAEELDIPIDAIDTIAGDTDTTPDEGGTFASLSMMTSGPAVRLASCELRGVLTAAAAERLGCAAEKLSVENGKFFLGGEEVSETYWTCLAAIDLTQPISGRFASKAPRDYRLIGSSPRAEHLNQRIGAGAYIHDLAMEGQVHGRVLRQPYWGAQLSAIDLEKVSARRGVISVFRDGDFVGLIADSEHTLSLAMEHLSRAAKWEEPPVAEGGDNPLDFLDRGPTEAISVCQTLEDAGTNWEYHATYSKPLLAHGSIGPSCGIARFADGQLDIWTHSQNVTEMRRQFARVLEMDAEKIRIRHMPGAGCYGHNGADDVALDAVLLARAAEGKPVRVQWSRRDELTAEPFGSPMRVSVSASLTDGCISGWQLKTRSGTHVQRPGWAGEVNLLAAAALARPWPFNKPVDVELSDGGGGGAKNSVAGYDFPQDVTYEFVPDFPFRLSALRSLGAFANVIAIESAMDDLAEMAGADPLEFRMRHLKDPRSIAVLEAVADMSAWGQPCAPGTAKGIGFAQFENELSYCAVVAHVAVEEDVQLLEMWAVVDAGLAVDPAGVRAQVEGGMIQGASWTLKEAVPTLGRRVTSETWQDYPILRFNEVPDVTVKIISRPDEPSMGVGEVSLGPTGAAISNAVAAALGIRIRDLPITRDRIIAAIMES